MPLVTVEELAGYLKKPIHGDHPYTMQLLLDGACAAVVEYCGWHIAPLLEETVTVDGTGTSIQTLPTLNLVTLDGVDEEGQALDVNRIDWSTNGVLEKRSGGCWTNRRKGIVADITHGYAQTPSWVTTLICAVSGRAYVSPLGITQEAAGGESVTYAATAASSPGAVTLLAFEKRMLDRIRVPLAA